MHMSSGSCKGDRTGAEICFYYVRDVGLFHKPRVAHKVCRPDAEIFGII